jgi:acetoacetyl-CoA synthetase
MGFGRELWAPTDEQVARSALTQFKSHIETKYNVSLPSYDALHEWSVDQLEHFWQEVWSFAEIRSSHPPACVLPERRMPLADWFPGARLNFAENLLRHRGARAALVVVGEDGERTALSYDQLRASVASVATWLSDQGVVAGDRVAGFLPNRAEAVIAMLAATSLGATWSSCSPDFGKQGVLDRFGQIEPKILVACEGYRYGGKAFDTRERVLDICRSIPRLQRVLWVGNSGQPAAPEGHEGHHAWSEAMGTPARPLAFVQLPFNHPLYIMYSSGTTGVPKCIVHGAGGTLLQHAKEHLLHGDLREDDVLFYFTTTGWMMWNWLVSGLIAGCTVVLYDGSPGTPNLNALWSLAEREKITILGTSPKFLATCRKAGLNPGEDHALCLRTLMSTGAPLSAELFEWVYAHVAKDVQLASICGGTDIISCFMLGSPISPVYAGEIQKPGLGMKVEAWQGERNPVRGAKGELVCTEPFVSMPVSFYNDPDHQRYLAAYFDHFPGIWRHGDYVEITDHGGVIVYGRSDATLNPSGIRIGTAEIDRVVESRPEVLESMVVGQSWHDDLRVVLFVVLAPGHAVDDEWIKSVRGQIRQQTTPRHVPAKIIQAPALPRTLSGKKVEIAVTRMIHGDTIPNRDAMANPEALDFFCDLEDLRT